MSKSKPELPEDLDGLTFEQAMARLDDAVKALEAGGLALSDATRLFEEGMKLARVCSEMLASAELRITRIQTAYGDQMRMVEGRGQTGAPGVPGDQGGPPC